MMASWLRAMEKRLGYKLSLVEGIDYPVNIVTFDGFAWGLVSNDPRCSEIFLEKIENNGWGSRDWDAAASRERFLKEEGAILYEEMMPSEDFARLVEASRGVEGVYLRGWDDCRSLVVGPPAWFDEEDRAELVPLL